MELLSPFCNTRTKRNQPIYKRPHSLFSLTSPSPHIAVSLTILPFSNLYSGVTLVRLSLPSQFKITVPPLHPSSYYASLIIHLNRTFTLCVAIYFISLGKPPISMREEIFVSYLLLYPQDLEEYRHIVCSK